MLNGSAQNTVVLFGGGGWEVNFGVNILETQFSFVVTCSFIPRQGALPEGCAVGLVILKGGKGEG